MRFRTYFIAFDFLLSFLGERNCAHYIISVFAVWVVRHPCIEIKKKPLTRSNKTKPFRHRDENPKSKRIRWREEKMIIKQQKGDVVLFKFKFKYLISGYKCFILLFFVLIFLAWFIANKGLPHHYCCCLLFFFLFRFSAFFGRGGGRWAGARKPQSRTREWQWMETKELTASYSLQCIRAMTAYFQQQQQQKKKNDAQEKNVFFFHLYRPYSQLMLIRSVLVHKSASCYYTHRVAGCCWFPDTLQIILFDVGRIECGRRKKKTK